MEKNIQQKYQCDYPVQRGKKARYKEVERDSQEGVLYTLSSPEL